jgi:hypothetical protein
MSGRVIKVTGVKLTKSGKIETAETKKLSVSARVRQRKSKRVRVKRGP